MQEAGTLEERTDRFRQVYELYLDGMSFREIGVKFGVSHECIRQLLKRGSTVEEYKVLKMYADKRRGRTWQTTEAINLLNEGNSCSQVAKILGVSLSAVKRLSTEYNKKKKLEQIS